MTYRQFFLYENESQLNQFKDVFKDNVHKVNDDLYYVEGETSYEVPRIMYEHDLLGYGYGEVLEVGKYTVIRHVEDSEPTIYGSHEDLEKSKKLFDQLRYTLDYDQIELVDDQYRELLWTTKDHELND